MLGLRQRFSAVPRPGVAAIVIRSATKRVHQIVTRRTGKTSARGGRLRNATCPLTAMVAGSVPATTLVDVAPRTTIHLGRHKGIDTIVQ